MASSTAGTDLELYACCSCTDKELDKPVDLVAMQFDTEKPVPRGGVLRVPSKPIVETVDVDTCAPVPLPEEAPSRWSRASMYFSSPEPAPERVAPDEADDANAVLKGVVRAERLPDPTLFLVPLLRRCDPKHVRSAYDLPFGGLAGGDGDDAAAMSFAEALARKMGRLLRGGEPDVRTVAVQMINDWQRGKLPHFVPPPAAAGDASGEPEAAADDLAALEDANEAAAQTALDGEAA